MGRGWWSRRQRMIFCLFCGAILSGLQQGNNAFCVSSLRPIRAYGVNRSAAPAATATRLGNDDTGEPQVFGSVEDLEALTVARLKAELKIRGLKQSGKKADLVRLLGGVPGVFGPPSPPLPPPAPAPASAPHSDVLSDDEVARWMVEDTVQRPEPTRSPTQQKKARSVPPLAVAAEEVVEGLPPAKSFAASRLGSEVPTEFIRDAEFAEATVQKTKSEGRKASLTDEASRAKGPDSTGVSTSASNDGAGINLDLGANDFFPPDANNGFKACGQRRTARGPPATSPSQQHQKQLQLPGPTEDMKKKAIIMDLLERRETTFELEEGLQPAMIPRSDVYVVSSKQALRPWDGPHADRAETHVVVLLTDVFGFEDSFTRSTADEIAGICNAIIVVPDIFRKRPWTHEQPEEEYEAWRDSHNPNVVASDIRACVDFVRREYKPTSLGLMGFCYGGGRALEEAAAGVVEPDTVVVFYPTRYDIRVVASEIACPVAAFFAEHDCQPGATIEDAHALREQLGDNQKVPDFQVKLCPGAGHGFAHRPMKKEQERAEDAMLLATSWLEMYLQKHFPTQPGGVKESEFGFWELPAIRGGS